MANIIKHLTVLGLTSLLFFGTVVKAQETKRVEPENYRVQAIRIDRPVKIDGHLDESHWSLATPAKNFTQLEPNEGQPASESTEVRILYDKGNLYFGIICYDSQPDQIVANEMRRDEELDANDMVMLLLDTFHDHRNCFLFCFNPLGTKRDGLITDEGKEKNFDWDGLWTCAASSDSLGWYAEVAIPFRTLRFRKEEQQIWGFNVMRLIRRRNEVTFWTPMLRDYGMNARFKLSKVGHITGLSNLKQKRNIEFKPYVLARLESQKDEGTSGHFDAGLDLKYGITPNLTADLTYNTDFAQVEADQEQINLSRFSLFFPEKRDFFLEGAGTFYFGEKFPPYGGPPSLIFFFSRRIGLAEGKPLPILGGLRLTGKVGDNNVGLLNMQVRKTELDNNGSKYLIPSTNFSVLRLKRDILEKSNIGFIFLNKAVNITQALRDSVEKDDSISFSGDYENEYNRVLGVDANFSLFQNLNFGSFLTKSYTSGLRGKDWTGHLYCDWQSDLFSVDVSYTDIQENFNTETGFLQRTGVRKTKANFGYGPRPNIKWIRQSYCFFDNVFYTNHKNVLVTRENDLGVYNVLEDGGHLLVGINQNYEKLYDTDVFEIRENMLIKAGKYKSFGFFSEFGSDRSRMLFGQLMLHGGGFFGGNILGVNFQSSFNPSPQLSFSATANFNKISNLPVLDLIDYNDTKIDFTTTVLGGRLAYSYSAQIFSRAFLQWNSDTKEVSINFLLNYIYRPGSDFYLVYNEVWEKGIGLYTKERTIALKISHLLHL